MTDTTRSVTSFAQLSATMSGVVSGRKTTQTTSCQTKSLRISSWCSQLDCALASTNQGHMCKWSNSSIERCFQSMDTSNAFKAKQGLMLFCVFAPELIWSRYCSIYLLSDLTAIIYKIIEGLYVHAEDFKELSTARYEHAALQMWKPYIDRDNALQSPLEHQWALQRGFCKGCHGMHRRSQFGAMNGIHTRKCTKEAFSSTIWFPILPRLTHFTCSCSQTLSYHKNSLIAEHLSFFVDDHIRKKKTGKERAQVPDR